MVMLETWGDYPLFLSILRVSKMRGFHHAAAIFTSALLFPNPFSYASTNLGKGLAKGFTSAVFTKSLPPSPKVP